MSTVLIGLCGAAGAGKTTAAEYLAQRYGFAHFAMAEPIHDAAEAILQHAGAGLCWVTDRGLKEHVIPGLGISARQLMQRIGTEVGRGLVDDLWIRILQVRAGLGELDTPVADRIVISDIRFANEAGWLTERGGTLLRLVRDVDPIAPHQSELGWREMVAIDVLNDGTVGQLHTRLDALMRHFGIEEVEHD